MVERRGQQGGGKKIPAETGRRLNRAPGAARLLGSELIAVDKLREHPRNYRSHPDDQIAHLVRSLRQFGLYRNVVAAKDGTILAGHGVVRAARKAGLARVPVVRLNLRPDDPAAIKVLVGDNEIEHLAEQNDRLLSELLKEVKDLDELLGTGFDEKMLAAFAMVTRPQSEIRDFDEAAAWAGMPEYDRGAVRHSFVLVSFASAEDRGAFARKLGVALGQASKSMWYPPRKRDDVKHVRFEAGP